MPFEAADRVDLGRTGLQVTRLGFGARRSAACTRPSRDADARATVERAWQLGIRTFDVAPLYGYGAAERRLGAVLAGRPRDAFVLSTKVGRLVRRADEIPTGADIDRQAIDGRDDAFYVATGPVRMVFDYSADGIRRSIDESLVRLGLDRIDIALIHDPDEPLGGGDRRGVPGARPAREAGRRPGDRRRDEPVRDAGAVRPRGRLRRVPPRRPLHAPRPGCARRAAPALRGAGHRGARGRGDEQRDPRRSAARRPVQLRAGSARGRRSGAAAGRGLRPGTGCRSAPRRSSSRSPIRRSGALIAGVRRIDHLDEYPELLRRPIPAELCGQSSGPRASSTRAAPVPDGTAAP